MIGFPQSSGQKERENDVGEIPEESLCDPVIEARGIRNFTNSDDSAIPGADEGADKERESESPPHQKKRFHLFFSSGDDIADPKNNRKVQN
mgnify:CR=1 FL=1